MFCCSYFFILFCIRFFLPLLRGSQCWRLASADFDSFYGQQQKKPVPTGQQMRVRFVVVVVVEAAPITRFPAHTRAVPVLLQVLILFVYPVPMRLATMGMI